MRQKRKPMKKLLYITTTIILLIIIGTFITWHQSTNYILSILTSSNSTKDAGSPQENKPPTAPLPETKEQSNLTTSTTQQTNEPEPASSNETQQIAASESKEDVKEQDTPSSPLPQQDPSPTTNKDSSKSDFTYSPGISTEKAQKVQDSISLSEKAQVTSVLLKKLSAKELNLFIKMASGGLTVEEKKEAKKIILEKLTEEEYNQLIGIAAKYGLSQGKNYSESQKEKR